MDFTLRLHDRAETARGHGVADRDLQTGRERISTAKALLDAGELALHGVDHLADSLPLDSHRGQAAGQFAPRCGNEGDRHGVKTLDSRFHISSEHVWGFRDLES